MKFRLIHLFCMALLLVAPSHSLAGVMISEIMYNPSGSPETQFEWVEIVNTGSSSVDLTGWRLDDEDSNDWGSLSGSLAAGQVGIIFNSSLSQSRFSSAWGLGSDVALFGVTWGSLANTSLDSGNEILQLLDGNDREVDLVNYEAGTNYWPGMANGRSIYVTDLSLDNNLGRNWGTSLTDQIIPSPVSAFGSNDIGTPGVVPRASASYAPEPATFAGFAGILALATARRRKRVD